MPNSPQVNINLIGRPKVEFAHNFLKWTFNIGRIVIAATELVALMALGYRFFVDRKIADLHDNIKTDKIFVDSQRDHEANYLSVQNRLANIKKTEKSTGVKIGIMNEILQAISNGNFSSTNLTIDQNQISLGGVAFSIFPINSFINDLKKNPNISSISLDDFSSTAQGIEFKISIQLKDDNS